MKNFLASLGLRNVIDWLCMLSFGFLLAVLAIVMIDGIAG
jgi:hypothetical protein